MEERIVKENGHFVVDGNVVDIPDFPLEFCPSSEAMDAKLSGEYLHNLMYVYTTESYWKDIVPLCPKCGRVAAWTDFPDTTVDMVILHSMLLEWVLDHNCENQIRNADNKLVKLECGCELTVQDFIKPCYIPGSPPDNDNKIDYLSGVLDELRDIIHKDEKISQLLKESDKASEDFHKHLKYVFDEKLREEYLGLIRPKVKLRNFKNDGNGNFTFDMILDR